LASPVEISVDIEVPVLNIDSSPFGSGRDGSHRDKLSSSGIEKFKKPGSSSGDSEVKLNGISSNEIVVSLGDGSVEIEHSEISEVRRRKGGLEADKRIRVVLVEHLVFSSESGESSEGDNGVSIDGIGFEWDSLEGSLEEGIDLSSDISIGAEDLEIGQSVCNGDRVIGVSSVDEQSILSGSNEGGVI